MHETVYTHLGITSDTAQLHVVHLVPQRRMMRMPAVVVFSVRPLSAGVGEADLGVKLPVDGNAGATLRFGAGWRFAHTGGGGDNLPEILVSLADLHLRQRSRHRTRSPTYQNSSCHLFPQYCQ